MPRYTFDLMHTETITRSYEIEAPDLAAATKLAEDMRDGHEELPEPCHFDNDRTDPIIVNDDVAEAEL